MVKENQPHQEWGCRNRLGEAQPQPLSLLTPCPAEGLVVELPSTAGLESSAHTPGPSKTPSQPLVWTRESRRRELVIVLLTFPLCLQHPGLPGRHTLKSQAQRVAQAGLQRSSGFYNPKCQQAGKGRTQLGLWRRGWAHSISWEVDQPCTGSSRALKMVPRKKLPRN